MGNLRTDFKADILDPSMQGKKHYDFEPNADGTYSVKDKTVYEQVGDTFTNEDLNAQNREINKIVDWYEGIMPTVEGARDDALEAANKSEQVLQDVETAKEEAANSAKASKTYAEKTEEIYNRLGTAVTAKGTRRFEELPNFADIKPGYMYNMSNDFVTDERFKDGAGKEYGAGNNVYYIQEDGVDYWDIFAGATAVKVDFELDENSNNPVANKVIAEALKKATGDEFLESMEAYDALPDSKYEDGKHYIIPEDEESIDELDAFEIPYEESGAETVGDALNQIFETGMFVSDTETEATEPLLLNAEILGNKYTAEDIDEIANSLANYIVVREYTHEFAIDSYDTVNWNPYDDGIALEGYTPIGIVSFMIATNNIYPICISVQNSRYGMMLGNITSSEKETAMEYTVLYCKNLA